MSGGSYNYAYVQVQEFAAQLARTRITNPLRLAFADHLRLVANAMRDIEWVDSYDNSPGYENESIRACLDLESAYKKAQEVKGEK